MAMLRQPWTSLSTALLATVVATAGATLAAPPASAEVVKPFEKIYDAPVYGDFLTGGNTVLGCDGSPDQVECERAASGETSTNNNSIDMRQLDRAGMATATFNSTSGEYEIPPGAEIVHAQLMWGGNTGTYGTSDRAACDLRGTATDPPAAGPEGAAPILRVDGGPETPVTIDDYTEDAGNGPHYYSARSDVTALFQNAPDGTPFRVDVGDVWAPEGMGCVGGWSLTLVYSYDGPNAEHAPQRREVHVYYGHVKQGSKDDPTTVEVCDFYRAGQEPPRASTSILEGDRGVSGDKFRVNGEAMKNRDGSRNNFFNSEADYALDPAYDNTLGIDAKDFEIPADTIPAGDECAELTFETNGDTYVPFQVALSVPIPDLKYTKTAQPATVVPGGAVTYTVRVENVSDRAYPNAKFADSLREVLDEAVYNDDAVASTGSTSYSEPRLTWQGDLGPGESATVTYSVTVNDPPTGDRHLHNDVIVEDENAQVSNCATGSTDLACRREPVIEPRPTPPPDK